MLIARALCRSGVLGTGKARLSPEECTQLILEKCIAEVHPAASQGESSTFDLELLLCPGLFRT